MREIILSLVRTVGSSLGLPFSFLPIKTKKLVAKLLSNLSVHLPGKAGSLLYTFSDKAVKRMLKGQYQIFMERRFDFGSMCLDVSKKTQRILYLKKVYEPELTNYFSKILKSGDIFIDIGANVGYFTILASNIVGINGSVVSFEPEKDNFHTLKKNIGINERSNIKAIESAVGNTNGKITLYINPLNDGGGSLIEPEKYHDDNESWLKKDIEARFPDVDLTESIQVMTIDSLGDSVRKTRLIKMDVEGAEYEALLGMQGLMANEDAPEIIAEVSERGDKIEALVRKYGYNLYRLNEVGEKESINGPLTREKNALFSKK